MSSGITVNAVSSEAVVQAHKAVCEIMSSHASDVVKLMALDALGSACRVSVSGCNVTMAPSPAIDLGPNAGI